MMEQETIVFPRFVRRKIRHGRVKILQRWFYPESRHMQYDGRLDGMWYWFGLYRNADDTLSDFVALWGNDAAWENGHKDNYGPELVDGAFPWYFWKVNQ